MRYPQMSNKAKYQVVIPRINGGVNLFDKNDLVADNQLTECVNLWNDNGLLQTRPGLALNGDEPITLENIPSYQRISETETVIVEPLQTAFPHQLNYINLYLLSADGSFGRLGGTIQTEYYDPSVLVFRNNGKWTVLFENAIYELDDLGYWNLVEPYVPLFSVNGIGYNADAEFVKANGDKFEPYNELTPKARFSYSTSRNDENGVGWYRYQIPGGADEHLSVSLTLLNGVSKNIRDFQWDGTEYNESFYWFAPDDDEEFPESPDGFYKELESYVYPNGRPEDVPANAYYRLFLFYGSDEINIGFERRNTSGGDPVEGIFALPTVGEDDNLIFYGGLDSEYSDKIYKMTFCTWFGGNRSGIAGGTRLFVSGNEEEPNLVHWSALNNATYFPENNYAYIGDGSSPVTAFGKQQDMLVMFKPTEAYYSQYVEGEIDNADVVGGRDIEANIAKFPITQISATLGCDNNRTICNVNNRLVWVNSDGNAYMLTSSNQYNTRNIRYISQSVQSELRKACSDYPINGSAIEYENCFLFIIKDKCFVLDTDNSAFVSFSSYTNDSGNRNMNWHIWDFSNLKINNKKSNGVKIACGTGQNAVLLETITVDGEEQTFALTLGGDTDNGEQIPFSGKTKLFNFGSNDKRKSVQQMYVDLTMGENAECHIGYQTENGETIDPKHISTTSPFGATETKRLMPNVNRVRKFGMTVRGNGKIGIGETTIKYMIQGVIR